MDFYPVLIGIASAILVSFFLKLCNHLHLKRREKQHENELISFDLLDQNVSYQKYKKISQRKSVRNNPIRQTGGFLDFLISVGDTFDDQGYVENTIANANCGECSDE